MIKQSIFSVLRKRYPSKEYALMEEVRDKAGFSASRSADFIAVNLWPSRGLAINGIELKSHRSDWLNELKKPEKAENIFQYCDFFWLLTENDAVAKIEEIPETWGWLRVKGSRIVVEKDAPKLYPSALTMHFVCAMLKRAKDKTNYIRIDDIQERIEAAKESARKGNSYELDSALKERDELRIVMQQYKESSGIDLLKTRWGAKEEVKNIGEAVKFISNGGIESVTKQLLRLEETARITLEGISNSLGSLNNENKL